MVTPEYLDEWLENNPLPLFMTVYDEEGRSYVDIPDEDWKQARFTTYIHGMPID